MNANTARQRSRTYAELARAFSEAEPGLEQEFTRLFLGPGRPVAHPFESVYREGRTMGETTLDVRRRLADEGLAPSHPTLPDHLAIELAFMAHLAAREAQAWDDGDDEKASDYLVHQKGFLRDHLAVWLPQFCRRLLAGRPNAFYANLARRADVLVAEELVRLRTWLGHVSELSLPITSEKERWSVAVSEGCTMCGICVQVCRVDALQQEHDREHQVLRLRFEAALCDGCAGCQIWCPERIIRVDRVPDGECAPSGELARSAVLACPRCGHPHAPETMVGKVQAQMEVEDKALVRWLALCQSCRAKEIQLRMGNPSTTHSATTTAVSWIVSPSEDAGGHSELF